MMLFWIGFSLMIIGTILSFKERDFFLKLHFIGISDTVGAVLIILHLIFKGWDVFKLILMMVLVLIWSPFLSHVLARTYVRMGKK
mgnify:CR=1 FL=1